MKNLPWDFYQLFLQVARCGGLTGAAAASGLSQATIGRRMLELEQQTGRNLFARSPTGYRLTGHGQALLAQLQDMEETARRVDAWGRECVGAATVRISLGTWIAWLLAQNFEVLRTPADSFSISLVIGETRASLSYRESDIGVRAFEPEEPNLAARPAGEVAYAVYSRRNAQEADERWVAVNEQEAVSAYLRWPHQNVSGGIVAKANRAHALLDLVRAGREGRASLLRR